MSRKTVLTPYRIFFAADMSGPLTSIPIGVRYMDTVHIKLKFVGTPTGTFIVESSSDEKVTWDQVAFANAILAAGGADSHDIIFAQCPFDYLRIRYVPSSSTGLLTGTVMGKALGS